MRTLILLCAATLVATALPTNAAPVTVDLFVDSGEWPDVASFSYGCLGLVLPSGSTIRDAIEACAAQKGFATSYDVYGECYLGSVNGVYEEWDPSGFFLAGRSWHLRVDGFSSAVGICDTLTAGASLSIGYEAGSPWVFAPGSPVVVDGFVPNPGTVKWIAFHLP